ncbi:MAG: hypothetical protein WCP52_12595, partial [Bacteroidota bacterium]
MKVRILLFTFLLFCVFCNAQNVGINTTGNAPDNSAMLDIVSSNLGLLIPRVALTDAATASPITAPTTSLLIYNTATSGTVPDAVVPGYYYWNGTRWISLSGGASGNNWSITGNAGTAMATNFIGTTDNHALRFKVNNTNAGIIDNSTGITGFGYRALFQNTGAANTAMGYMALNNNIAGTFNTAVGGLFNKLCQVKIIYLCML